MNLKQIIELAGNTLLTEENIKILIEKEINSYFKFPYEPLSSDNILIEAALQRIRKLYSKEFLDIRKAILLGIKECNLTSEQEEEVLKQLKIKVTLENNKYIIHILI